MAYRTRDGVWRVDTAADQAGPTFELRQRGVLRMVARNPAALALWLRILAGVGLEQLEEG